MGKVNEEIEGKAAEWAARMSGDDVSPGETARFEAWLAADTRHLGAYGVVEANLVRLERLRAVGLDALRSQAPGISPTLASALVVASPDPVDGAIPDAANAHHWTRRRVVWTGGAAAAAGLAGFGILVNRERTEFSTDVGQTRNVTLSDGSTVMLNTASKLSVHFSDKVRRVRLAQGEAIFNVAKNKQRPFIVEAGESEVRAVGTSFAVRFLPQHPIRILVQEGVVEVRNKQSTRAVRAVAETQTLVLPAAPIVPQVIPSPVVTRNLAWQFGQLAFENEKLKDAADEFARYSNTRVIVDPAVADYTVTGMFASNDPVGFAKAVGAALKLQVDVGSDEVRVYN